MTTAVEIERKPDLRAFHEHWQDESDAAYLYGILARTRARPEARDRFSAG